MCDMFQTLSAVAKYHDDLEHLLYCHEQRYCFHPLVIAKVISLILVQISFLNNISLLNEP